MTQAEFTAYTGLFPKRFNIWYSETAPYQILGVSIPSYTAPPNIQDISSYIETLTRVNVPLTTGGSAKVPVLSKIRQTVPDPTSSTGTSTYYICTVTPTTIPQPTSTLLTGVVGFSPSIITGDFTNSPYNVTQGVIEALRTSDNIMQSDRYKVGTLVNPSYTGPLNIELLLSTSASKANIQDSLYSDTGWTNGRYNGSITNRNNYGATPAESGLVFKGAFYPKGISTDQIKFQVSGSQAVYEDFFYSGQGSTPGLSTINTKYILTGSNNIPSVYSANTYQSYETVMYLKVPLLISTIAPDPLKPGDLITIGTATSPGTELMKVLAAPAPVLYPTYALYYIQVLRGYLGDPFLTSTYQAFPANTIDTPNPLVVQKSNLSTIYKVVQNKLQPVPEGKLVVKESGAILKVDPFGILIQNL